MLVPSIFTNSLFDDFFDFPYVDDKKAERKLYGHNAANLMKTDIQEYDDGYQLEIDLPGFKKDEVHAELKDGYLVVSAEKGLDEDEQDKKTGKYLRRERYAGSCQRSFYVGKDITEEDRHKCKDQTMCIIKKPFLDQFLEIALIYSLL